MGTNRFTAVSGRIRGFWDGEGQRNGSSPNAGGDGGDDVRRAEGGRARVQASQD